MSIKDTIRAMKPLYGHERQGSGPDVEQLQALVDSHDALVRAAKLVTETYHCDSFEFAGNGPLNDLIDAIAEAEKL